MKGKHFILTITFLMLSMNLYAYTYGLSPWQGGFGLDMASNKYAFKSENIEWSLGNNNPDGNTYSDEAIIGIVGVYGIDGDEFHGDKLNISASCDGGFYFRSRSNPDAKRPFEIKLIMKGDYHDKKENYATENHTLGANSDLSIDGTDYPTDGIKSYYYGPAGIIKYDYGPSRLWCDLVICLPFDSITSTGVLTANGTKYNLIEATDYSAVVNISISFNDDPPQSITIPLSGYYSRNRVPDDTASLNVRTRPAAMNLNIGGPRTMERVADIDFMVNQTDFKVNYKEEWVWDGIFEGGHWETVPDYLSTSQKDTDKYYIFLSASNSPTTPYDRGFELVHSSVNYTEPHTPYNSIGYTARLVSDDTGEYMDFDGTDVVTASATPGIKLENKRNDAIIHSSNRAWYSEFHGGVEVMIDELTATGDMEGVTEMLHGQYTSTIYVHVVGDDS